MTEKVFERPSERLENYWQRFYSCKENITTITFAGHKYLPFVLFRLWEEIFKILIILFILRFSYSGSEVKCQNISIVSKFLL